MCGIVGLTDRASFGLLAGMNERIRHRGPDDAGEYIDQAGGYACAMRRLSILDLAGGHQPMTTEDGSLTVVFNGEIFNEPVLRKELEARGHRFRTKNSDTEVLLKLYADRGERMLAALHGMFAFVIYDRNRRRLFGARDRLGIKPFYYSFQGGKFAFASELKSLLPLTWISRDIDSKSLYHYLSLQFVPAPRTIFRDIQKLGAGCSFTFDLEAQSLLTERYWRLPLQPEERPLDEWRAMIRQSLEDSVRLWSLSDVPLACSLSGGLDSAAVVGLLATSGYTGIRTYSLGFEGADEQAENEIPLARLVAERWGTEHHEIILRPEAVLSDLDRMVWHLEEPYAGGLPSWYIYDFIGRHGKVCLTGTGGDELFGNYRKWGVYEQGMSHRLRRIWGEAARWRVPAILTRALANPHGALYHRYMPDGVKDRLLVDGHALTAAEKTEHMLEDAWHASGAKNPRDAVAAIDFTYQLPEEFLLVTDKFSMAHSVEARTPFLEHTLVEQVYRMPAALRTRLDDPKYFLRETIGDLLPPALLRAPKKGFVLPLAKWVRQEMRAEIEALLEPGYLRTQGIFTDDVWSRIVQPHMSGERENTAQVWTLFMFQKWYNRFRAPA